MENLWKDTEANKHKDILAERVYSSRLLGRIQTPVLHGGYTGEGHQRTFWEDVETLFVSSGSTATIEAKDFAAVRMDAMLKLSRPKTLSDIDGREIRWLARPLRPRLRSRLSCTR